MNPTQAVVEDRIASLEGGVGALLVASGQSAETLAILTLAQAGDHIVSSPRLYGGTYNLFHYTLPKFGITVGFVEDPDDPESWRAAIQPNTKALYGESISNPRLDVLDFEAVAAVAHAAGVPLIVDNTVPTPYLMRPLEHGADIVVHSATKYLGGHGTAIGGVIVDSGNFDWVANAERFPGFNTPDPSYNNLTWGVDLARTACSRPTWPSSSRPGCRGCGTSGPAISPFNAFLISQGIETLSLRLERHNSNAPGSPNGWRRATRSSRCPTRGWSPAPGTTGQLKYAPQRRRPDRLPSRSRAASRPAGVHRRAGAVQPTWRTSVTCVAWSSTRRPPRTPSSPPPEQLTTGVTPGLIRLAVGIEHIDDILADLEAGFRAAKSD